MGFLQDWFERNIAADDPYDEELQNRKLDTARGQRNAAIPVDLYTRPRLRSVTNAPSREDYAAWRDNPITEFVMVALLRNAQEYEDKWHEYSWGSGHADQDQLNSSRIAADTLRGIAGADYDAFCETLQLEPDTPNAA